MKINISKINFGGGGGKAPVVEAISITSNGTYTASEGVDGYSPIDVNVLPKTEEKTVNIVSNGQTVVDKSASVDGMTKVTVDVAVPMPVEQENKTVIVDANGSKTITPDVGNDAMKKVTLDVQVGGKIKTKILNGVEFEEVYSNFNPKDYDWSYYENVVFHSVDFGDRYNLQGVLDEIKSSGVQVRAIDISGNYFGTLDFRGMDLSKCYYIYIRANGGGGEVNDVDVIFDNCDFSSLEIFDVQVTQGGKNTLSFNGCVFSTLRKLGLHINMDGLKTPLSQIDMSKLIEFPNFSETIGVVDLSQSDLSNIKIIDFETPAYQYATIIFPPKEKIGKVCSIEGMMSDNYDTTNFEFPDMDLSICSNFSNNFNKCDQLVSVSKLPPMRSPYGFGQNFFSCPNLETVDLSNIDIYGMSEDGSGVSGSNFYNCPKLKNIKFPKNITNGYFCNLRDLPYVTKESLLDLISNLYDVKSEGQSKTMTIGSDNLAKLTADEIAVATAKGWTLQ